MEILIALAFFTVGTITFSKKIKAYAIACTFLFYLALNSVKHSLSLQLTYVLITTLLYLYLLIKSKNKSDVAFFTTSCWFLITSILINVFIK